MSDYLPLVLVLLFLVASCSKEVVVVKKLAELPATGTCRIGVLPFFSESPYPQGAEVMTRIFYSELAASTQFELVREGDISELYRQLRIYPNQIPNIEQLKMMASHINPDLFISGIVQKMEERKASFNFIDTELTMSLKIHDGRTGELLWTTYHHRSGAEYQKFMHVGRINTITALATRMSQEVIAGWLNQGMKPCAK